MKQTVYVVESLKTPLAGIPIIRKLNLISEINSLDKSKEDIVSHLPATDRRLTKIKEHQEKDLTLQKWKKKISKGGERKSV